MKRYLSPKTMISALMILTIAPAITSCKNEPIRNVDLYTDDFVIEHYTQGIDDYESTEYERIVYTLKYFDLGPHEPRYRGVIYLTEDEAAELNAKYEWTEVLNVEFEFDEVDIGDVEGPWYTCNEFQKDTFTTVNVHSAVFNGEAIVFDIQTT